MASFLWYLLPTFFGFVGYAIVANAVGYENKKVIRKSLKIASIFTTIIIALLVRVIINANFFYNP